MAAGSAGKNAVSGIASGVSNAVPSGNKDVQLPSNGSGTQGNTTTSAPGQSQSLSPLATTTEPSGSAASIPTSSNTSTISSKNAASVTLLQLKRNEPLVLVTNLKVGAES